ncbi:MAG: hypothetical protein C0407_17165, partial [Desulfobacca sp.]|nr:hypothetical protein [Desulfobacca sp.]
MKIFYKLLLLTLAPLTLTIFSIILVNLYLSESITSLQFKKSAQNELNFYTERIDSFFKNKVDQLNSLAASPLVRQSKLPEILQYLDKEQKRLSTFIEGLYYNELDGTVHDISGKTFSVRDRYYFPEIAQGKVVITKLIKSRATQKPIVLILVPIFNEKKERLGAIGGTILVDDLLRMVKDIKVGESGFAVLMDEDNQLISKIIDAPAPAEETVFKPLPKDDSHLGIRFLLKQMSLSSRGTVNLTQGGQHYQVYFQPLKLMKWRLALAYNEEDIFRVSRQIRNISILILSIALIVVFFITYSLNRFLVTPIRELISAQRQFGEGNLSVTASVQ